MLFRAPESKIGLENDIMWRLIYVKIIYARDGHDDM